MNDAGLAFKKLTTAIDVVDLHISAGSSQELIDAAVTQLEEAVVELTDCFPAKPLVPEPQLDLDDKAKMFVYRILELLEEDAEDMVEELQKVVSHLYKHVTGRWPHEIIKENDETMWLPQDTETEESRDEPDEATAEQSTSSLSDSDEAPGSATSTDKDEEHDSGVAGILNAGN